MAEDRASKRYRYLDVEADVDDADDDIDDDQREFIAGEEEADGAKGMSEKEFRDLQQLRREMESRGADAGASRLKSVIERLESRAQATPGPDGVAAAPGEGAEADDQYEYRSDDEDGGVASAMYLPLPEDYKLFLVRVAVRGEEQQAAIQILNKTVATKASEIIRAAFALESVQGYIYVEARSESELARFLTGIARISGSSGYSSGTAGKPSSGGSMAGGSISGLAKYGASISMSVVPRAEAPSVLRSAVASGQSRYAPLKRGDFVRVKAGNGLYKGDLGRVVEFYEDATVDVEIVPRIHLDAASISQQQPGQQRLMAKGRARSSGLIRPAPVLLTDSAVTRAYAGSSQAGLRESRPSSPQNGHSPRSSPRNERAPVIDRVRNPETGEIELHFGGELFTERGFVLKRFHRHQVELVSSENGNLASNGELQFWARDGADKKGQKDSALVVSAAQSGSESLLGIDLGSASGHFPIFVGEKVQIVSGDLRKATGTVQSASQGAVSLRVDQLNGQVVEVSASGLARVFAAGDRVAVKISKKTGPGSAASESIETGFVLGPVKTPASAAQVKPGKASTSYEIVVDGSGSSVVLPSESIISETIYKQNEAILTKSTSSGAGGLPAAANGHTNQRSSQFEHTYTIGDVVSIPSRVLFSSLQSSSRMSDDAHDLVSAFAGRVVPVVLIWQSGQSSDSVEVLTPWNRSLVAAKSSIVGRLRRAGQGGSGAPPSPMPATSRYGEPLSLDSMVRLDSDGKTYYVHYMSDINPDDVGIYSGRRENAKDPGNVVVFLRHMGGAGFEACASKQLDLIGVKNDFRRPATGASASQQASFGQRGPSGQTQGFGNPQSTSSFRPNLVGRRIQICKGQYKGLFGTIKEDAESSVQVALEAKFRTVNLPKDHLRFDE